VAFEELQQQQDQQRTAAAPRIKRYTSIEDETGGKAKSEPENLNVSFWEIWIDWKKLKNCCPSEL
jgi:hypothetical protein